MILTVGVDVGASKIAAAVVDPCGTVLERRQVPTPAHDVHALLDVLVAVVRDVSGEHEPPAVGLGVAAFVDVTRSKVLSAPNLPWRDLPLRRVLEDRLGLPVVVENDGNCAVWGEFRFGAGAGVQDVLLVTVGTGVGGGIIASGRLQRGAHGVAAEIGHLRLVPDGRACGCGARGCLEAYGSGTALARGAREAAQTDPSSGPLLALAGSPDLITAELVSRLAAQGDPFSIARLTSLGQRLGEGLASLAAILDPEVVLVGGGVSAAGELLLAPLRAAFVAHHPGRDARPLSEVRLAHLGTWAGVVGAADLAREAS
ncbi:ROK family glucokinase [Nocardioides houyundeii]|uniref:ROK family glucokinase n=1 Tax=Nocardioides houyundeii TaxID=2045452 RepID=UPI000C76D5AE|nr:ROK family glucokinase [Nocardioides houyundeii]